MGRTACTEPQCLYKGDLYLYLYYSLHNNPEEYSYLLCGGSLKSHKDHLNFLMFNPYPANVENMVSSY